MAITSSGVREEDPRKIPIEEMVSLGELLMKYLVEETYDEAVSLCEAFYRTLGFYKDGGLKVEFTISTDGAGSNINVCFFMPDFGWSYSRVTYFRSGALNTTLEGVYTLQNLKFILDGAVFAAAERMFLPLEDIATRKKFDDALYYALAKDI
jgi:hypothetical protein